MAGGLITLIAMARTAVGRAYAYGAATTGVSAAPGAAGKTPRKKKACSDAGLFACDLAVALFPLPHVDEMSRDRGGGGHCGRDKVSTSLVALASFEVAVRG